MIEAQIPNPDLSFPNPSREISSGMGSQEIKSLEMPGFGMWWEGTAGLGLEEILKLGFGGSLKQSSGVDHC